MMIMSLRASLNSRVPQSAAIISIGTVAAGLHLSFPISCRDLVAVLEPIQLAFELNAGTCSGSCAITMGNDGLVHYTGAIHDSGLLGAKYVAITSIPVIPFTDGFVGPIIIAHLDHVGGTLSLSTRNSTWDETATDARIADNWAAVKRAAPSAKTQFGTDTGAIDLIDALATTASGVFVFKLL